ncbi:MAG: site-specific tyrosine recombinase XerD [Lachnospiraceae bacterium]|nr:site-specific tyrosine recombinase XerD [Lachnospiraceae bacterium]
MKEEIGRFIEYLHVEKQTSKNTEVSYERDLRKMSQYLKWQEIDSTKAVTATSLNSYVMYLEQNGMKPATISRSIASMKAFFSYLQKNRQIDSDPSESLKAPKIEKKLPSVLTTEEMSQLLEQPSGNSPKELRDKAMLELLYATGIRVSELISLKLTDINLQMEYISCIDAHKERIIPFGKKAKEALKAYLKEGRPKLVEDEESEWLFTNCSGQSMSRQGFWKLIKYYGGKAGIESEITPHTLRHSFAAHMVGNGADLKSVQEMLGYADISAAQIYMQMNQNQKIREAYVSAHPRNY